MAQKTIQCCLIASSETRQYLWSLAAEKNTPLITELIRDVVNHPEFGTWRIQGRHPADTVTKLCAQLKSDERFSGQPSRFYASAEKAVNYIFKSWFTIQSRLQLKLSGKQKWLEILKSDDELVENCEQDLASVQKKAAQILKQINNAIDRDSEEQSKGIRRTNLIRSHLFKKYHVSKQPLSRCATAYLLKNGSKMPLKEEDPARFAQRRRKAELQVERLQTQIESRVPKGRDLTGESWLETLLTATSTIPEDNREQKQWQDRLLAKPKTAPYPILFETNEDLVWSCNQQGRLCVHFNGLSSHMFKVYCDQRHLPWFERFLKDQQTKRAGKNQHSSALFILRSARISWQEKDDKGRPWDNHYLTLSCTVDDRLWSAEGTDEVRAEKAANTAKILTRLNDKANLSKTQEAYARRLNSTLNKLNGSFDRPNQPLYRGQSNIVVGISLGWDKPLTLAVWNANTQEILAYRSLKQLLGKDYSLFLKQRQEQQKQSHNRHKAQRQGKGNQFGTSSLGQHVDRLLAKAVVLLAKQYDAGSIAIPKLDNIRNSLRAEIDAQAERKIPGYLEGQKRYSKQYKCSIHQWSYGRLIDQIAGKSAQIGLVVEKVNQPISGNHQEKAKEVAIAAYESRQAIVP